MSDVGSPGPGGEKVPPEGEPAGLEGAIGRGVVAKEAWVRDGLLVGREAAAQRWGVSLGELAEMVGRGELFELEVSGQLWVPAVFLELPRDIVAEVNHALAEAGTDAAGAFVFWHRKQGALGGRAISELLVRDDSLARIKHVLNSVSKGR